MGKGQWHGFTHQFEAEGKGYTYKRGTTGKHIEVLATMRLVKPDVLQSSRAARIATIANPPGLPSRSGQHQSLLVSQIRGSNQTAYTSAASRCAHCCRDRVPLVAYSPGLPRRSATRRLCDMQDCREPRLSNSVNNQSCTINYSSHISTTLVGLGKYVLCKCTIVAWMLQPINGA